MLPFLSSSSLNVFWGNATCLSHPSSAWRFRYRGDYLRTSAVIINTWLLWLRAKDPSWRDTGELMAKVSQAARGADGSACRPGGGAPSSQSSDVGKHCGVALPRLRGSDTLLCLERGGIFDSMQKGTFTLSYLSLPKVKKSHLTGSLREDPLKHWYLQVKDFK